MIKKIIFNDIIICYEDFKYLNNNELKNFIDTKKYQHFFSHVTQKLIIVLGGDGTMLSAIRDFRDLNLPFLGINFGNKGFLLNDLNDFSKNLIKKSYPILKCELTTNNENKIFYAFNELDIRAGDGRLINLEISLEGKNNISILGDGVIFSTPAGSTGYNSSLGGPIIPYDIKAFVLTFKAPFLPKGQTPILFSQDKIINIRNIGRKNKLEIYFDSNLVYNGVGEDINLKISKNESEIDFFIFEKYLDKWQDKVMFEQGFKN